MQRLLLRVAVLATGFALIAGTPVHAGTMLISADEAKLPPPKGAIAVASRGITRGPKIAVVSPGGADAKSPMRLQLKFESFGGAKIDLESVKVTYLKSPSVDLTPRLKPFVKPDGIDLLDAELPAGDHVIRVDVKDSDGRPATTNLTLKVVP